MACGKINPPHMPATGGRSQNAINTALSGRRILSSLQKRNVTNKKEKINWQPICTLNSESPKKKKKTTREEIYLVITTQTINPQ